MSAMAIPAALAAPSPTPATAPANTDVAGWVLRVAQ